MAQVFSFPIGRIALDDVSGYLLPQISIIFCLPVTRKKYFIGFAFIYNIQFKDLFYFGSIVTRKRRSPISIDFSRMIYFITTVE